MSEFVDEQLTLGLELRPLRTVQWFNCHEIERGRLFGFLGKKVVKELVTEENSIWPKVTKINAEDINKLTDPDLRYALRFADAASALGWIKDSPFSKIGHHVWVDAIDDGLNSKFLGASYTGIVGEEGNHTFLKHLQDFGTSHHENHGD